MLKNLFLGTILILSFTFGAFTQNSEPLKINDNIQLYHLNDSVFVHTSWHESQNFGRFPSNGLVIIKNGNAILVDTPMDNEMTKQLTDYIENNLNAQIQQLIIGHYHDDCLGGLGYLQTKNIESIANVLTLEKCEELGLPIPSVTFTDSLIVMLSDKKIVCNFFGAGHSIDNITVWIPENKILFGGCLVKSQFSENLGYTGEAVIAEWDKTVEKIQTTYPVIEIVVPGHGRYGGNELLQHTVNLVRNEQKKLKQNN